MSCYRTLPIRRNRALASWWLRPSIRLPTLALSQRRLQLAVRSRSCLRTPHQRNAVRASRSRCLRVGSSGDVDGPLAESEQTRALSALLKRAVAKRTVRRRSGPRAGRSQAPAPALTRSFDSDPPLPLFDLDGFGALDRVASVHPREWARQLTRREFDLLERIGPSELLRQAWAGAEKKARAPNVLALVGLANATAAWVASVVLSEAELCARAEAYGHLVDVAVCPDRVLRRSIASAAGESLSVDISRARYGICALAHGLAASGPFSL